MNVGRIFIDAKALIGILPKDELVAALQARKAAGKQLPPNTPLGRCREYGDDGDYGTVFIGTDKETQEVVKSSDGKRIALNLRPQKKDNQQAATDDVSDSDMDDLVAEAEAEDAGEAVAEAEVSEPAAAVATEDIPFG